MIQFDEQTCGDLQRSIQLEWLETNGLGGFASATIAGANTRRYHGLLTAATRPPVGRFVLLSKLEETLVADGRRFDLSVNLYPGAVHPRGEQYLKDFRLDPFPIFTYQVEGLELEKRVFMAHGENTTVVEYELRSLDREPVPECSLEIRPLLAFRDYHGLTHANGSIDGHVEQDPGIASVMPYRDLPRLYFAHNAVDVSPRADWYYNTEYPEERERGLDDREDLYCPFLARFDLTRRAQATVIASLDAHQASDARRLREAEIARRASIREGAACADPLVADLTAAADQYIVKRGDLKTVIAGYHWFADWGRDTMIALPGLSLVTGRPEIAKGILLEFGAHVDQGMLPNCFPDSGATPEYNTVDATLWYFEAIRAYVEYTGDIDLARTLYPTLKSIIDWHLRGTRYGIHIDYDGLLMAGTPGAQLTWMDAKISDWVVTPRHGKPVEIQALWYNALRIMEDFAHSANDGDTAVLVSQIADRAHGSFNRLFWNHAAGCLYDVVNGDQADASIRPNQVLATSLAHTMLTRSRAKQALAVVERELLTPMGLRTLSPADPAYRGVYAGGPAERDAMYHQGTVWPWLLGPFITGYVRAHGESVFARRRAAEWLADLREHLSVACLGQVSEILDGNAPHRPRGCVAQAWSVAEILRAAVEDVHAIRPASKAAVQRAS